MTKALLKNWIQESVREEFRVELSEEQINIEHPTVDSFGDYTTNIALTITKFLSEEKQQSPLEIAESIVKKLQQKDKEKIFSKIDAVKPGFINLTLSLSYLNNYLKRELKEDFNSTKVKTTEKVLVEHTSPNTNKPLHIGHLRNATLGNAILNILHTAGYNVVAGNINNDRGIHIIKSMYGYLVYGQKDTTTPRYPDTALHYKDILNEWIATPEKWETPASKNMKPDFFVGHYYILGNNDYEDSEKKAEETGTNSPNDPHNQMQQMLIDWEAADHGIRKLWKQNNDWYYQGMHQTLKHYGVNTPNDPSKFFDKEWYESEIYKEGKDIILEKLGNGVITEFQDGHIEAVLEKYKLPNVVLLRKNKTSLYITQDIELMRKRIKEDHYDRVFILTDAGQNLRFQQLFAVCDALDIAPLEKMKHFGYGTVRLPEGKMSSRKGTVIQADDLINMVQEKAKEKINEERSNFSDQEKEQISKMVAIAAIKYGMLKYNALSNITFDIEKSIAFEGDTGPYIQYTHARACSIIRKYDESNPNKVINTNGDAIEITPEETSVIRALHKYPDTVLTAAKSDSPNYICEYLFDLAQKFNHFYTTMPIMSEKNESKRQHRLLITHKTIAVLKSALGLLGIEAPEKM